MYSICDRGHTHVFYLRNQPLQKKYTDIGLSPLHAQVFYFKNTLSENFHDFHFDHLYMSEKCICIFHKES